MKLTKPSLAFTALTIFSTTSALAQSDSHIYATGLVGLNVIGSENLNYRDDVIDTTREADFDASFTGGGTLGYYLTDNWRVEGEVVYRRNDLNDITIEGIGASTGGDFASLNFGLSALYEFEPFDSERLSAYVGAGVMLTQEIDIDFEIDGEETSFETDDVGVQVQVGGRYNVNENFFVDTGLRYLTLSGVELEFPADTRRVIESDYSPLSFSVGFGWRF